MTSAADIISLPSGAIVRGGRIFIQNVAPDEAADGDIWFDTVGGVWKRLSANIWNNVGTSGLPIPKNEGEFLISGAGLTWTTGNADAGRF